MHSYPLPAAPLETLSSLSPEFASSQILFFPCQGNWDVTAPLRRIGYYFCLSVRAASAPFVPLWLLVPVAGADAPAPSSPTWAVWVPASPSGWGKHPLGSMGDAGGGGERDLGVLGKGPRDAGQKSLGCWGRVPGQSSCHPVGRHGSGTGLRGGHASSLAVANAWHNSCISGSVPRERGNQKYLPQREAQRAAGPHPAPSEEAAPWLHPEEP